MTMRVILCVMIATLAASSASAQVFEIGTNGAVKTYDRPTVFRADSAVAIVAPVKIAAATPQTTDQVTGVAAERGLDPALFLSVAMQESDLKSGRVSAKGAIGVMQLMPGTAAELGVDANDPLDNMRGGALYLRRQLDRFGSVPLALAAYNAGPGAVIRYHGIPPFAETQAYVSRILRRWRSAHPAPSTPVSNIVRPSVIEVAQP